MSQTVITKAFERLKAQQAANGSIVTLDEFVFANVPDLNITDPINRDESWPAGSQIVHRQAVSKTGMVNENAVVYSVVLGADTGDFDFNWVGLVHKSSNTVAMIVHAPLQKKIKTAAGQQGNVLTRSFLMEYNGASQQTQIISPADTWQIDFTARLAGMDERARLENIDIWGDAGFINDGFMVTKSGSQYGVKAGAGYVSGLRAELLATQDIAIADKPSKVWVDVCWRGTLSSEWHSETKITVADALADYYNADEKHYVFALAEINADGSVTDLRPKGSEAERKLELKGVSKDVAEMVPEAMHILGFNDENKLTKIEFKSFAQEMLKQPDEESVQKYIGLNDLPSRFLSREKPFSDIKEDGVVAVNTALENLGTDKRYKLKKWVSPGQVLVTNTPTIVTHGLVGLDVELCTLNIRLRCVTANNGYSVGDYAVGFAPRFAAGDTSSITGNNGALLTSTTAQFNCGQSGMVVMPKSNGVAAAVAGAALSQWVLEFVIIYQ